MRVKDMQVGDTLNCSKCGLPTRLTETMRRLQRRICNACQVKAAVEWSKANRDRKRAANNRYHKSLGPLRNKYTKRYRDNNPEKRQAHLRVQTAMRNGSLERQPCEVCGSGKSVAHHDDYSKPLEVRWFCHQHHMELHQMLKERKQQ